MSGALRVFTAAGLAAGLSRRGYRKGSLSYTGALASATVGLMTMGVAWSFGLVLIAFYLTCSRLTKLKQARKAALDAHFKLNGQRNATQVLCSSAGGSIAAAVAAGAPMLLGEQQQTLQLVAWAAFLGHYACCCGDTWASELGLAYSTTPPRLITSLRRVPHGVNGAVSGLGLAASAAGGALMGALLPAAAWLTGELTPLLPALHSLLRGLRCWLAGPQQQQQQQQQDPAGSWAAGGGVFLAWIVLGVLSGVCGGLVDSLLGASLQFSGFCEKSQRVVGSPGPHVRHISGRGLLSNEAVNAAAAAVTALGAAAVTWWLLTHPALAC